ncbi:Uncharacterised protein [Mycobacteroides abscessus subsp. abscessus]|nr:Uncharacterised protein [Mycobacteroides abscessus subsp. abscessus]
MRGLSQHRSRAGCNPTSKQISALTVQISRPVHSGLPLGVCLDLGAKDCQAFRND